MKALGLNIDCPMQTMVALLLIPCIIAISGWACNNAQTWLNLAEEDLPVVTQQAQAVIQLADPTGQDAATAQLVSGTLLSILNLGNTALAEYEQNPNATNLQKLSAAINAAIPKVPAVMQGIKFLSPSTQLAVQTVVTAIAATLTVLAAQLPVPAPAPITLTAQSPEDYASLTKAIAEIGPKPTPKVLRAYWNSKVCSVPGLSRCPAF